MTDSSVEHIRLPECNIVLEHHSSVANGSWFAFNLGLFLLRNLMINGLVLSDCCPKKACGQFAEVSRSSELVARSNRN